MCTLGLNHREAAEKYGMSYDALRQRSLREEWPVPERVSKLVAEVSQNRVIAQKQAETLAEKGEIHRALAFKVAHKAMQEAEVAPPEIKDWADVERIDKMARRAAGLDNDESKSSNSFNINLINSRMELPPAIEGEYVVEESGRQEPLPE